MPLNTLSLSRNLSFFTSYAKCIEASYVCLMAWTISPSYHFLGFFFFPNLSRHCLHLPPRLGCLTAWRLAFLIWWCRPLFLVFFYWPLCAPTDCCPGYGLFLSPQKYNTIFNPFVAFRQRNLVRCVLTQLATSDQSRPFVFGTSIIYKCTILQDSYII